MASSTMPLLVVVTGPESRGNTTLAEHLAAHFDVPMVAEVARHYLQQLPQADAYQASDLLHISDLQQAAEGEGRHIAVQQHRPLFIADTDLQVIYIWWQEKFGPAPQRLISHYAELLPRHYLLCQPDLPWQPDALRENPFDRQRLFELYHRDLRVRHASFDIVMGQSAQRWQYALDAVSQLLIRQSDVTPTEL